MPPGLAPGDPSRAMTVGPPQLTPAGDVRGSEGGKGLLWFCFSEHTGAGKPSCSRLISWKAEHHLCLILMQPIN